MKADNLTANDAGCWLDGARGQYIGEEVQNIAANCGWKGETLSADQEWYCEAWDEAEQYLNGNVAPKGFFFGTTSWGGDWGLWSVDEDEVDSRGATWQKMSARQKKNHAREMDALKAKQRAAATAEDDEDENED